MAHLTDMEELLARIPRTDIRDYMREALSCYMCGAYRGAMVLSFIALFDDLMSKLAELANVNIEARVIFEEANKKKGSQDVYESYLIDQLASKKLISGLDNDFLNVLRILRNKSAHPSGHRPSPEESRYVYFEVIDRFMSKPILSTTHLVDELIARLKNDNFFPSTNIADITDVVSDELAGLHDEALPQLVAKMSLAIIAPDAAIKKNSNFFLTGLSKLDKSLANNALQTKLIASKVDDEAYQDVIIQVISANGKLIAGLAGTPVVRLKAVLIKKISEIKSTDSETKLSHPTSVIISLAKAIPSSFLTTFREELEALFEKRAHSEFIVRLVEEHPTFLDIYHPILIANAGSSNFNTANIISSTIESLDASLARVLTDEQSLQLIVAIIGAANRNAWDAIAIRNTKFARIPNLRKKAVNFTIANEVAAAAIINEPRPVTEFVTNHLKD